MTFVMPMETEASPKASTQQRSSSQLTRIITYIFIAFLTVFLFDIIVFPFFIPRSPISLAYLNQHKQTVKKETKNPKTEKVISKLRDSVTFLPLKDLRFAQTAVEGNTWFMSSLADTYEKNEAEYLYFPSKTSRGRLLCIMANDTYEGTNNYYALAWSHSLPKSAILLKGLSFISSTYYDYKNLWHEIRALAPFVGWSLKNKCLKPRRWVLFKKGALQNTTGAWLQNLMRANFGEIPIESFKKANYVPYCFEKAVVMRHDVGKMGREKKYEVYQQIRCKARSFCGLKPGGKGRVVNRNIIRLTLLMRRGSRAFKDPKAVAGIFRKECEEVGGCVLKVAQSEDLTFCQQVALLTYTDILASPHGAQMTNMIFMDRNSTVMEFFPKGWLELAGRGQYVFHWLAEHSGMKHPRAWWEKLDKNECPNPKDKSKCFKYYKHGLLGHNATYFAEWARTVLKQVKLSKLNQIALTNLNACAC